MNDAERLNQWDGGISGTNWWAEMVDADLAWPITAGWGIDIGVIDSGFDTAHEDLRFNVERRLGSTASAAHGTHVAGIICAQGNNGVGIAGIAFGCDLTVYGLGETSGIIAFQAPCGRSPPAGCESST